MGLSCGLVDEIFIPLHVNFQPTSPPSKPLKNPFVKRLGRAFNAWVARWPQTKEQTRSAHDFVITGKSAIRENPEIPRKKRLLGFDRHGRYQNLRKRVAIFCVRTSDTLLQFIPLPF